MALYMYQAAYTAESVAAQIKEPQDRLEAVRPALEAMGGKIVVGFTDRRLFGSASDLGSHVAYMFATAESKDQRGRGRSLAGSVGPPSLVAGERGGRPESGRLTSPGRCQKAARRTWRTLAGPVGKAGGCPLGEYDVLVVFEAPDDTTAASIALAVAAGGAARAGKTTRLLSGQECIESLRKAQSSQYRPAR